MADRAHALSIIKLFSFARRGFCTQNVDRRQSTGAILFTELRFCPTTVDICSGRTMPDGQRRACSEVRSSNQPYEYRWPSGGCDVWRRLWLGSYVGGPGHRSRW